MQKEAASMNQNVKHLVDSIERLVSLPDVCVKLNRLLDSPAYSATAMGEIVVQDTDLSARLLSLVNSSFFGLRAPVETISRAVAVVGTNELRSLAMATAAARVFTGVPKDLVDMNDFWRHSILTGVISQELAKRVNVLHSERLLVMGILHDIGRLVIYLTLSEQSRDILLITGGNDSFLPETEQEVLGFTHMDVGAELLRKWRLPDSIVTVAGTHHNPLSGGKYRFESTLVHFAIVLSNAYLKGGQIDEALDGVSATLWELTGLIPDDIDKAFEVAPAKALETMELIVSPTSRTHVSK
jgi:putative nucleotidyltransferase with HDIG domain